MIFEASSRVASTTVPLYKGMMTIDWLHCVSYFFGAAFFTNAIPHFVSGLMGRAFQSPFAKPPGKGLSSSLVNVVWGAFNFVIAYLLIVRVGSFDLRSLADIVPAAIGALVMALFTAYNFGKLHGGNLK